MKTGLIVTAAGQGTRFGSGGKTTALVQGKPLIIHTCLAFEKFPFSYKLLTVDPQKKESIQALLSEHNITGFSLIKGGLTRKDSVYNAFISLPPLDRILIHDGARPWVSSTLIEHLLKASLEHQAVIPVLPITDTVKEVRHQTVVKTLDRTTLFRVQTPQIFDYTVLQKAYASSIDKEATDEAFLMEAMGVTVHTIPGEEKNIKITFQSDI